MTLYDAVNIDVLQLNNLERKWQHSEQNNFVVKECILERVMSYFI